MAVMQDLEHNDAKKPKFSYIPLWLKPIQYCIFLFVFISKKYKISKKLSGDLSL